MGGTRGGAVAEGAREPMEALAAIEKLTEPSLVVLKDFHPYLNDPAVIRGLRELAQSLKTTYTTVILLSPVLQIPTELEKEMTVLDVPLPTHDELYGAAQGDRRGGGEGQAGLGEPAPRGRRGHRQGRAGAHALRGRERLRQGHRLRLAPGQGGHRPHPRREAAGHPQERAARVLPDRGAVRERGRPRESQDLARPARQRLQRAGPPLRAARAEGAAAARRAGLRQEPHRQGHRLARGRCRSCGSTWGASSAAWWARRRRTCAGPSASPRAWPRRCSGPTRSRRGSPARAPPASPTAA